MQLLPDVQRIDPGGSFASAQAHPEPLPFPEVPPGHVDENRHSVLAHHKSAARLLHCPVLSSWVEAGTHPCRWRCAAQPETQIEDGESQIEHCAATGLIAPLAPAE